ncbi:MAG: DUF1572 domain-containing protein, partial [Candidatus Heimdallarchaeota archaeon]|nr:DUF1572 domain-containing protein [Candidatus Heimdallarchaeota archaeon]
MNNNLTIEENFMEYAINRLERLKIDAEKAISQIQDDQALHFVLDEKSNSISILIRHLVGNMKSRWTDFFTSDGEKPTRNRPMEFDRNEKNSRLELLQMWDEGWNVVLSTVKSIQPNQLLDKITIRDQPHTIL